MQCSLSERRLGEESSIHTHPRLWRKSSLLEKIHPLAIGAIEQTYALAKPIAKKCLGTHMDSANEDSKISEMADKLCDEFKSHTYFISRNEARSIGLNAVDAPPQVDKTMMDLWKFYQMRPLRGAQEPGKPGSETTLVIAWLDSLDLNCRVNATYEVRDGGELKFLRDCWTVY